MNLAIISPAKNAYSETFIQAHKEIPGTNVKFYFGGLIPTELEQEGPLMSKKLLNRLSYGLRSKLFTSDFKYDEESFLKSLKKEKIKCVLAEYGPTGVSVMPVCKKLNIPLIVHFHGFDASVHDTLERYGEAYNEMFKYASAVVAVSTTMRKKLISLGCNSDKIHYTPCAPRDEFFDILPDFSKKQFAGIGRFVDKKAPYYTILAFTQVLKEHPDASLIIGGDGPLFNMCINLIKYLDISDNVTLPGVISPDDFRELLKQSMAFVQHSITAESGDMEGTPVGVSEASAAGLPVVSTIHAGIPDVILNGESGLLVEEHDVDGMAKHMLWIIDNPEKAKQMGMKGKQRMRENFSMDKHLSVLANVISKCL